MVSIENMNGSSAANVITDAVGANSLSGGGNDTFVLLGDNARDMIAGGGGVDAADYSSATVGLTVDLGSHRDHNRSGTTMATATR